MSSFFMLSFDIESLDIVSSAIESFFMLSFFMESLDIESFDIVSFFMVSSAKAAGASTSPNDKVAADRIRAVCLIMAWKSPGKAFCARRMRGMVPPTQLGRVFGGEVKADPAATLQDFERSRRLLRTRKRN